MSRRIISLSLLACVAAAVTGCGDPELKPLTTAPPGAIAELHENRSNDTRSVRLTEGVAIAIECVDAKGRPCSFDGTTIDDASIAMFRKAFADLDQKEVRRSNGRTSHLDRSVFVVAGRKAGRATMTVRTGYGDIPLQVEVLPAR